MAFKFSQSSLNRLAGVHSDLQRVAQRALEISVIDFGIPPYGGIRTTEEQNRLFHQGKSKADGYTHRSYHQSGNALDFFAFVDGQESWDDLHLALVAAAFLQAASELGVKLEWGGLWKSFKDYPHVQLAR